MVRCVARPRLVSPLSSSLIIRSIVAGVIFLFSSLSLPSLIVWLGALSYAELFSADGNLRSAFAFRLAQPGPLRPWLLFAVSRLDDSLVASKAGGAATAATVAGKAVTPAASPVEVPAAVADGFAGPVKRRSAKVAAAVPQAPPPQAPPPLGNGLRRFAAASAAAAAVDAQGAEPENDEDDELEGGEERGGMAAAAVEEVGTKSTPATQRAEPTKAARAGAGLSRAAEIAPPPPRELAGAWTVVALKAALRARKLPVSGRKADLLARLETCLEGAVPAETK